MVPRQIHCDVVLPEMVGGPAQVGNLAGDFDVGCPRDGGSSPNTWCNSRRNASSRLIAQLAISSAGTTSSTSGSASMSASVSGRK